MTETERKVMKWAITGLEKEELPAIFENPDMAVVSKAGQGILARWELMSLGGPCNGRILTPSREGVLTFVVQYEDAPQRAFFYDVRQLWPSGEIFLVERSLSEEAALAAARALGIVTNG